MLLSEATAPFGDGFAAASGILLCSCRRRRLPSEKGLLQQEVPSDTPVGGDGSLQRWICSSESMMPTLPSETTVPSEISCAAAGVPLPVSSRSRRLRPMLDPLQRRFPSDQALGADASHRWSIRCSLLRQSQSMSLTSLALDS